MLTPEQKATKAKNAQRYAFRSKVNRRGMRYGITVEGFSELLEKQNGVCAICGGVETYEHKELCVDHDHACCTGRNGCGECVRGLLCSRCNKALGGFKDDPVILERAVKYLVDWEANKQPVPQVDTTTK